MMGFCQQTVHDRASNIMLLINAAKRLLHNSMLLTNKAYIDGHFMLSMSELFHVKR